MCTVRGAWLYYEDGKNMSDINKPLIVQSDKTMLLEVDNEFFEICRAVLTRFAELEKSPEYLHTYRITPLSLWNAASSKMSSDEITNFLDEYSKYPVPKNIIAEVKEQMSRYGKVKLVREMTEPCSSYPRSRHF